MSGSLIIGRMPREFCRLFWYFLKNDGEITCRITGSRRRSLLVQGGLEIPCLHKCLGRGKVSRTFYLLSAVPLLRQRRVVISPYMLIVRHLNFRIIFSGTLIRTNTVHYFEHLRTNWLKHNHIIDQGGAKVYN